MTRIGIIGLGFMGRMHISAYAKLSGARLVAVADQDEKRASGDFSGGWGNIAGSAESLDMTGITGTTDFQALIRHPDVDVVDICVPTPSHEALAVAALEAGKHVLCEKPLALDSSSAERMAQTAARAKGLFMPAMCMRFWPQWAWLKQAVDEKRYGRVLGATFRRVASMPPGWFSNGQMSGGALLDLHIHDTDFVFHLFGRPDAVFSRGYSKTSGRTDHIATRIPLRPRPRARQRRRVLVHGERFRVHDALHGQLRARQRRTSTTAVSTSSSSARTARPNGLIFQATATKPSSRISSIASRPDAPRRSSPPRMP